MSGRSIEAIAALALAGVLGTACTEPAEQEPEAKLERIDPVPPAASEFGAAVDAAVRIAFPDARIPGPEDLTAAWSEATPTPYAARGDFDGDGQDDLGLLILKGDLWHLVVLLQVAAEKYEPHRVTDFPGGDAAWAARPVQEISIASVPAGQPVEWADHRITTLEQPLDTLLLAPRDGDSLLQFRWSDESRRFRTTRIHLARTAPGPSEPPAAG